MLRCANGNEARSSSGSNVCLCVCVCVKLAWTGWEMLSFSSDILCVIPNSLIQSGSSQYQCDEGKGGQEKKGA